MVVQLLREVMNHVAPEPKQPCVISVRKSPKGCAVVLLRNQDVWQRAIDQTVAVIDNVCVEMRAHVWKGSQQDDEESNCFGIFVAWGFKVERRVPVDEEAIREYFEDLAARRDLKDFASAAERPFDEEFLRLPIRSSGNVVIPRSYKPKVEVASLEKLRDAGYCDSKAIEALWREKDRVEAIWEIPPPPMGRSLLLRVARVQLFPHSGEGKDEHKNRAGEKLAELSEAVDLMSGVPRKSGFLDLCGGPGAWSQYFLNLPYEMQGYGFTLKSSTGSDDDWHAVSRDDWYPDLMHHRNWTALWGSDGTGDLLKTGNLDHCALALYGKRIHIVAADGGFSDNNIPAFQQELFVSRLILAELLMAVSVLERKGKFICKFYTAFSDSMAGMLFAASRFFDDVSVVKPQTSRATGPERYLVATGFRGKDAAPELFQALRQTHYVASGESPLTVPLVSPVVPRELMHADENFMTSLREMGNRLCVRQALALKAVVDRTELLEEVALGKMPPLRPFKKSEAQPEAQVKQTEASKKEVREAPSRRPQTAPFRPRRTRRSPERRSGGPRHTGEPRKPISGGRARNGDYRRKEVKHSKPIHEKTGEQAAGRRLLDLIMNA